MKETPFPDGYRLMPAGDLRRRQNGRTLIGGTPFRVLRLSEPGAKLVSSWFGGQPVGSSPAHVALARRLVDTGLANGLAACALEPDAGDDHHTASGPDNFRTEVTAVIPVRDDTQGLRRTLAMLHGLRVVVVDDGSIPAVSSEIPAQDDVVVLRRDRSGGPAAARNLGLREVSTPLTLFVDAGVELEPGALAQLVAQLDDPSVAAAAPRITSCPLPDQGPQSAGSMADFIGRYERTRSPLDLGTEAGRVGPMRRLSYVPSACLLIRTEDAHKSWGFDEELRYGEDVDLIWRLTSTSDVLYHPDAGASHPPRPSLAAFIKQRVGYGSAAGPLGKRHGDAVAPVRTSGWSLAVAGLMLTGHPLLALGLAAGTANALVSKLEPMPDAAVEATILTTKGHWWTLRSICQSSLKSWWPLTGLALITGVGRKTAMTTALVGWLQRLSEEPSDPVAELTLGLVDDLSYGTGVVLGAWRERSLRSLRPHIVNWQPKNGRPPAEEVRPP